MLTIHITKPGRITLRFYTGSGKLLAEQVGEYRGNGIVRFELGNAVQSPGVYILRAEADGKRDRSFKVIAK